MASFTQNGITYNLTAAEIAAVYGRSVNWARWAARKGRIPSIRMGRDYLFNREQVDAVIASGATAPQPVASTLPPDIDDIDFGVDPSADPVLVEGVNWYPVRDADSDDDDTLDEIII